MMIELNINGVQVTMPEHARIRQFCSQCGRSPMDIIFRPSEGSKCDRRIIEINAIKQQEESIATNDGE